MGLFHEEWERCNQESMTLFMERGTVVLSTFKSTGKPQLRHPFDRRLPDNAKTKGICVSTVEIQGNAWIGGLGSVIVKGVTVGHHVVVDAHSVVVKDVSPHSVVGVNPHSK